jgi:hypothetical protein
MIDLLDYNTSPLNPALKLIIFFIFLTAVLIYLDCRKQFGGNVKSFIDLLSLFVLFMTLGALFRFFGDGTDFGFTADYSLKWFQSLCYLAAGVFAVLSAHRLLRLFMGAES